MNKIEQKFKELKEARKKALVVFLTCGYPALSTTAELILALADAGVDIIELGVPFSDPIADGPLIQEASYYSLSRGTNILKILNMVKKIKRNISIPICIMSYYNPIFCLGINRFLDLCQEKGIDGIVIPDLPIEEAEDLIALTDKYSIDLVSFISPTTTLERIKKIVDLSKGFIYYVSLTGVTGSSQNFSLDLARRIRLVKTITTKPICVGFGIGSAEQARKIWSFSDGIIIGSAIIKKIKENLNKNKSQLIKKILDFVRSILKEREEISAERKYV